MLGFNSVYSLCIFLTKHPIPKATTAMKLDLDRLTFHRDRSEVSAEQYLGQLKLALHDGIKLRHSVYLDTKFWVNFRKIMLGEKAFGGYAALLDLLRLRVADGTLFCPMSESIFSELCKQDNPTTRAATAALMDELSLGISLDVFHDRMATEIACVPGFCRSTDPQFKRDQLVWTKVAFVFGPYYPAQTAFNLTDERAIQKTSIDRAWSAKLGEIIDMLEMSNRPADSFAPLANLVNNDNEVHASEIKSFKQSFEIGMSEVAEVAAPFATDLLARKFEKQCLRHPTDEEILQLHSIARQTLTALLNYPQSQVLLPTLHVYAALHTFVRWNKGHQLTPNDFPDFHHACAALGYCDVFLTEKALKSHLTSAHLKLDMLYDCTVVASIDEALEAIRGLDR